CFERRPLCCAAVLENSLTIFAIHVHMLTGLPPQRCVAVPATAADSSWPETACSLKLSPLSAAFRQFPRDEILLLRRAEKRRVDAASVMPLPAPRPSARTDARLAPAAPAVAESLCPLARSLLLSSARGFSARRSTY